MSISTCWRFWLTLFGLFLMPKIIMRKMNGNLVPIDDDGISVMSLIKHDDDRMVTITKPRNLKNHRRFFKFLDVAFDIQDQYMDDQKEEFRKYVLLLGGHYDEFITPTGQILYFPKSMDFASMDELEFIPIFKACIGGFVRKFDLNDDQFMDVTRFD